MGELVEISAAYLEFSGLFIDRLKDVEVGSVVCEPEPDHKVDRVGREGLPTPLDEFDLLDGR